MNNESSKLRQDQKQEVNQAAKGETKLEFASAEELLRHDATLREPPDSIIERLNRSLANEPKPKAAWWQRLFSK